MITAVEIPLRFDPSCGVAPSPSSGRVAVGVCEGVRVGETVVVDEDVRECEGDDVRVCEEVSVSFAKGV